MKGFFLFVLLVSFNFKAYSQGHHVSWPPSISLSVGHPSPYIYHGTWQGFPVGYGYYNPWLPYNYPQNYGYSYYAFYNYQPYYASYAAIAYDHETDKGGYAWGFNSRYDAQEAAVNHCESNQCKPIVWVQGGCAALASHTGEKRIGWSYAASKHSAIRKAIRSCNHGAITKECENKVWVCSF